MKRVIVTMLVLGLISSMSLSCDKSDTTDIIEDKNDDEIVITDFETETVFTDEELTYLKELKSKGELVVATRQIKSVYQVNSDNTVSGFNYLLLKQFADEIGVSMQLQFVNFSDYFKIDGEVPDQVKTDPGFSYIPDLFNEVDVYCDVISVLPWREKIVRFVKIAPVRQMVLNRENEEIKSLIELKDAVIALKQDTSYENRLKEIEEELGVAFTYLYVEGTLDQQDAVSRGDADVSIQDSNLAVNEVRRLDNLSISISISDVQEQGWAVSLENENLGSILDKYIMYAAKTGSMDDLWHDEYGITMLEYLKLLDL